MNEKNAAQVSLPMDGIMMSGLALWMWCGIAKKDLPLSITSSFPLLRDMAILIISI